MKSFLIRDPEQMPEGFWRWKHFDWTEVRCPYTHSAIIDEPFLDMMDALREMLNRPVIVSSWYRSPEYNARIGGAKQSAHLLGRGVDIAVANSQQRYDLVRCAYELGFTGIGIGKGFVHLDNLTTAEQSVRPNMWEYYD